MIGVLFHSPRSIPNKFTSSALAIVLLTIAQSGNAQTMVCPDEIVVSPDASTCEAVLESNISGADLLLLRNIPASVVTGNGTSVTTIDVAQLYDQVSLPFDVILADFIYGTIEAQNNVCTTKVHLVISTGAAMYCTCPDANSENWPTPPPDADNDLVCDTSDNCPNHGNPQQTDSDNDGVGDVCDPTPGPKPLLKIGATPLEGSFILKSQNGLCWQVRIADDGSLESKQTRCN
jgi:hypothetical protein